MQSKVCLTRAATCKTSDVITIPEKPPALTKTSISVINTYLVCFKVDSLYVEGCCVVRFDAMACLNHGNV